MIATMLLYWETFGEFYTTDQIVSGFNPLREYEDEFVEGPILDIGCGQSNFLIEYSVTGRELFAVDNEQYQLEKLQERINEYSKNSATVKLLNITLLQDELPQEAFSLVILSNLLHFFSIKDNYLIVEQILTRTVPGSLIYVGVHSDKYYANNPEDPKNNDYFKHYFNITDLDCLFNNASFERIYFADIQRESPPKEKLLISKWLDKSFDYEGIVSPKRRKIYKSDYMKTMSHSDLICIYRRK